MFLHFSGPRRLYWIFRTSNPKENNLDFPTNTPTTAKGNTRLITNEEHVIRWFHIINYFLQKFVSVNRENVKDGISVHRVIRDSK